MELLILVRPFFQLVNQYVSGFTYLFSLAFFICFIRDCAKSRLRFKRFEIIALCYFVLSIGTSFLAGASAGTVVGQFNKLFLCLFALLTIRRLSTLSLNGKLATAVRVLTYASSLFVLASLVMPSSYRILWGVKTFQMAFSSQHEAAALITLLIALVGYDLKRYEHYVLVRLCISTGLFFALLMTGARTITIAGCAIYLIQVLAASRRIDRRLRGILLVFVAVVVVVSVLPALFSTALFEKSSNLEGNASSFSNGRDQIWEYYFAMYSSLPTLNKLFGAGVGMIVEHSVLTVGTHNDFLSFLISYGFIGLILYFVYVVRSFIHCGSGSYGYVVVGLFLWCAFFNGFSGYTELVFAFCVFLATHSCEPALVEGF
ncbi:O-antigen ligase family protein [Collinsella sp. HCP3S3_B1]|uniref:O-antigen ligase family protein n=1 Tax=unclassified Collinsella TaxID=2637548 RepID=UPI003F89CF40